MRRLVIILFAAALAACTTVEHRDYGYYGGSGDYFYGYERDVPWYDPYDSLFWGLRYSYYDPFFYPHFHYGVTYFPRYYGWGVGWSSWYAWRHWHPYSPYYGSYWDHYYDWWRYQPHRGTDHLERRMAGRRAGTQSNAGNDPARFGSARNAAERMSRMGRTGGAAVPIRHRAGNMGATGAYPSRGAAASSSGQRGYESGLPSRSYVPRDRERGRSGLPVHGSDAFGPAPARERPWRSGGSALPDAGRGRGLPAPERPMRGQVMPESMPRERTFTPATPGRAPRTETRGTPAPRLERPTPSTPSPRAAGEARRTPSRSRDRDER